jgi:hypothetical protein
MGSNQINNIEVKDFEIIIPKEEPKQETLEEGLLNHIKFCLECGNKAQAIRLIEKYGFEMQEQDNKLYSEEEVLPLLEMLEKCKEYFLLKIDAKSEERADAIGQAIEDFKKFKNK